MTTKPHTFTTATQPPSIENIETDPNAFAQLAAWVESEIGPDQPAITKRGRPPKGEKRTRLVAHSVKTSRDEWKRLQEVAKKRGITSNAMLRTLIAAI
jgi:hypothetical protein